MNDWWASTDREPLNLYGRRRVGKSWLFRRFAHGRPAVILVADRTAPGQQLSRIARELEPTLGFTPQFDDVASLFQALYRLSETDKILVVIDEFPYLLGTTEPEQQANLSSIQAVMEQQRDSARIKLILTGSAIAQMQALQSERSPLHGRLVPLPLWPLTFAEARPFLAGDDPHDHMTRFAIAGGMPRYLSALSGEPLSHVLAERVVDRRSQLFNEPRTLLQSELREPAVYFSILSELAGNPQDSSTIADRLRVQPKELSPYLANMESLRLVTRHRPVGAPTTARSTQWRCEDHFVRFWFRFVQPYQGELEAGADALAHVNLVVMPNLGDHTAPAFEQVSRDWLRRDYAGRITSMGSWWGPALHSLRARKERFTEEIDAVGLHGKQVVVAAEVKWTNKALGAEVLLSLREHKLPALSQAGFDVTGTQIVLISKSGFSAAAGELADHQGVRLIDAAQVITDLR